MQGDIGEELYVRFARQFVFSAQANQSVHSFSRRDRAHLNQRAAKYAFHETGGSPGGAAFGPAGSYRRIRGATPGWCCNEGNSSSFDLYVEWSRCHVGESAYPNRASSVVHGDGGAFGR